MFDWLADPHAWVALATLTLLELVLGIDNIVFITILAGRLPAESRPRARKLGLALAMITRILLLLSLAWVIGLTEPMFTVASFAVSGRDLILLGGGLFLLAKSTHEIHQKMEGASGEHKAGESVSFSSVILQIMILDIVFSLDSVITAVGMVEQVGVMITAVVLSVILMVLFANPVGDFVERHPTVTMLALSFLLLIGSTLVAEGLHFHIPRGYIYFAMGFSLLVEMLNQRLHRNSGPPVRLHERIPRERRSGSRPGVAG
jgi:predicted tellurium resistance membrane protein TerC